MSIDAGIIPDPSRGSAPDLSTFRAVDSNTPLKVALVPGPVPGMARGRRSLGERVRRILEPSEASAEEGAIRRPAIVVLAAAESARRGTPGEERLEGAVHRVAENQDELIDAQSL